jgi:sugar lactone lactonase YvrE
VVIAGAAGACQVKEGVMAPDAGRDAAAADGRAPEDRTPDAGPSVDGRDGPLDTPLGERDGGDAGAVRDATIMRDLGQVLCPPVDAGAGADADAGAPQPLPDVVDFLPAVTVSTLVGSATAGSMDGPPDVATFSNPVSLLIEPDGALLVCDFDNASIRRVDAAGAVTTLTSQPLPGPFGLVRVPDGTVYFDTDYDPTGYKDRLSGTLWRLDTTSGAVTVVAADIGRPRGLAALADGRLALADYQGARIRIFDPASGMASDLAGLSGCMGFADGQGTGARFARPYGLVVLADGRVVVTDYDNHRLRVVTADGRVSSYAGDGGSGTIDGPRLAARFVNPDGLVMDAAGNLYISDAGAHRVRRLGTDDVVSTVAGDGTEGFADGPGAQARFFGQEGIAVTADGKTLFVADGTRGEPGPYNRIRKIAIGP